MATRYRDLIAPTLLDTRAPDSGEGDVAATLARSFDAFQNTARDVGMQMQTERGRRAGEREGMAGTAQPRQGLRGMTAFGSAYNNAAEAAYSARAQQDIHETISRIELEVDGDDAAYDSRVKGYEDEFLKNTPEEFRPRVEDALRSRGVSGRIRVQQQAQEKHRDDAETGVLESMAPRISGMLDATEAMPVDQAAEFIQTSIADNEAQIDTLTWITPARRQALKDKFRKAATEQLETAHLSKEVNRIGALARGDMSKAVDALTALESDPNFDDAEKHAVRKAVKEEMGLLTSERSRKYAKESALLGQRLAKDEYGPEIERESDRLWRLGAISDDELRSNFSTAARNEQKAIEAGADAQSVAEILASGRGLDPANKKQTKALDKLFVQSAKDAGAVVGDDRWQKTAIDLARRSNVLPASAESWARTSILSSDPALAAQGAGFYTQAKEANPAAFKWAEDPKMDSFATQLSDNLKIGMDPERAYEVAHKNVYDLTDSERKVLEFAYRADNGKIPKGNADALRSALNDDPIFDPRSPFEGVPEIPIALTAEHDRLTESYFNTNGGDAEKARAAAAQAVKTNWRVSTVNGKRELMKYAPEARGLAPEIVRADAQAVADEVGHVGPFTLTPNALTDRTQGLVWSMTAPDEFGFESVVRDSKNAPVLYRVPAVESEYAARREQILQEKVEDARQKRAALESVSNRVPLTRTKY